MDQTALIREKVDIISLISEFVPLKKTGRNFKANCPFHQENTPSFVVSPERQIWHCFGCQKGGDCYTFLMEYEHLEFPEALRLLAKRTGVELVSSNFDTENSSKKELLYRLNAFSSEYYHYILMKHPAGKKAREYLIEERKIHEKVLETFKVGYSPIVSTSLVTYLQKKKNAKAQDLIDAGLAVQRYGRIEDFFSNRIMFPLIDHRDNVTGFSGRVLTADARGPKYINTRDTFVYHKGDQFFGFHIAKETIKKTQQAMLVEGEFDVLSCFQEGITNVLAIKGTALTEHQAALLARFAQTVAICFDGDSAGQEAIKRSLGVLEKKRLTTSVVLSPNGKDPDEALKKDPYGFKKALKADVPVYDYLLTQAVSTVDLHTASGKKEVTDTMLPLLMQIENEIIKEHYLKKLSAAVDTTYESLMKELTRREKKTDVVSTPITAQVKRSREEMLEEYLVALVLQAENPKHALEAAIAVLSDSLTKERAYQKIMHQLLAYFTKHHVFDGKQFGQEMPPELVEAYNKSYLFSVPPMIDEVKYLQELKNVAEQLRTLYLKKRLQTIAIEIKQKEKDGGEVDSLKEAYSELANLLEK